MSDQFGDNLLSFKSSLQPSRGTLLVANPFMPDSNFKRTVVLLADHSDRGTIGFVLNRGVGLALGNVVDELPLCEAPLYYGGPVQLDSLHYLYRKECGLQGGVPVADGIYMGTDFAEVKDRILAGSIDLDDLRFFLGYSGWESGQLDGELKEESWIVVPATQRYLYQVSDELLWQQALQDQGGRFAYMTKFPADPTLN